MTAPGVEHAVRRLDEAMAGQGLELVNSYRDGPYEESDERFEVREYGDPDSGRAWVIHDDGRVEETDR